MKTYLPTLPTSVIAAIAMSTWCFPGYASESHGTPDTLYSAIAAQDAIAFDHFNHCDEPGRLDRHASHFSPDVEFYHDTGGVTWTREKMIENTGKYVCGNFRRELVPGTLQVHPVKGFGAISQGTHRFCQIASGQCEGIAEFTMVWHQQEDGWKITRVLSYGHRAADPEEATP